MRTKFSIHTIMITTSISYIKVLFGLLEASKSWGIVFRMLIYVEGRGETQDKYHPSAGSFLNYIKGLSRNIC